MSRNKNKELHTTSLQYASFADRSALKTATQSREQAARERFSSQSARRCVPTNMPYTTLPWGPASTTACVIILSRRICRCDLTVLFTNTLRTQQLTGLFQLKPRVCIMMRTNKGNYQPGPILISGTNNT